MIQLKPCLCGEIPLIKSVTNYYIINHAHGGILLDMNDNLVQGRNIIFNFADSDRDKLIHIWNEFIDCFNKKNFYDVLGKGVDK